MQQCVCNSYTLTIKSKTMKKLFMCVAVATAFALSACNKDAKKDAEKNNTEQAPEPTAEQKIDAERIQNMKDAKAQYEAAKGTDKEREAVLKLKEEMQMGAAHYSDLQKLGDSIRVKAFETDYLPLSEEFGKIANEVGIK